MGLYYQAFTGGAAGRGVAAEDILRRLRNVPVQAVIVGWSEDPALYRELGEALHRRGAELWLWFPVFSEHTLREGLRRQTGLLTGAPLGARVFDGDETTYPVGCGATGNDLKPLRCNDLRVWRRCASAKKLTCKRGVLRAFQARERSKSRGCAQRASIAMPTVPLKKILTRQRSRPISNRAAFLLRTHIITACLGQNVSASYFSLKLVDFSLLSGYNKGASYFGPKEAEQCILRDSLKKSLQQ